MTLTLHQGDSATELRKLPAASVQLAVTSPPYLGLRKYNAGPEEIGQEPTWAEHLDAPHVSWDTSGGGDEAMTRRATQGIAKECPKSAF